MKEREIYDEIFSHIKNAEVFSKDDFKAFIDKVELRIKELISEDEEGVPLIEVFDWKGGKYFKLEDKEKAINYVNQQLTKYCEGNKGIKLGIKQFNIPKSQVELYLERDSLEKEHPQITKLSDISIEDFGITDLISLFNMVRSYGLELIESDEVELWRVSCEDMALKYFKLEDKEKAFAYAKQYFNDTLKDQNLEYNIISVSIGIISIDKTLVKEHLNYHKKIKDTINFD